MFYIIERGAKYGPFTPETAQKELRDLHPAGALVPVNTPS